MDKRVIFTVRCANADRIAKEIAETKPLGIYSIIVLPEENGYVLFEAEDEFKVREALRGISGVYGGIIRGEVDFDEIVAEELPFEQAFSVGQTVLIRNGPFKGERGKISKLNPSKEELTLQLTSVRDAVPVPITLKAENVSVRQ